MLHTSMRKSQLPLVKAKLIGADVIGNCFSGDRAYALCTSLPRRFSSKKRPDYRCR